MKTFLVCLSSILLLCSISRAELTPAQRAQIALALANATADNGIQKATCACGPDCSCAAGECGDSGCPPTKNVVSTLADNDYRTGVKMAERAKAPLVVFTGDSLYATDGTLHFRVRQLMGELPGHIFAYAPNGTQEPWMKPYLVCAASYDAEKGCLGEWYGWRMAPTASAVRDVTQPGRRMLTVQPLPTSYVQPQFFGGNIGGGSCSGGR